MNTHKRDPKTPPFSDVPQADWILQPNNEFDMQLTKPLTYVDWSNVSWPAPARLVTDGASIPRALWSLVGSPFTGHYRRAALVHDEACNQAHGDTARRKAADRMFYEACRDGGCSAFQACLLYLGVRIGAHLHHVPAWASSDSGRVAVVDYSAADLAVQRDYSTMAKDLEARPPNDDASDVEARVGRLMLAVAGVPLA